MTLLQLEASAQAPCTSTITGVAGCPPPDAAAPVVAPAGVARPGAIASRAAARTTARSAGRLMRRAVRLSDMSASSLELLVVRAFCRWHHCPARRRGSPPWESLVGPLGPLAQPPAPRLWSCPAVRAGMHHYHGVFFNQLLLWCRLAGLTRAPGCESGLMRGISYVLCVAVADVQQSSRARIAWPADRAGGAGPVAG